MEITINLKVSADGILAEILKSAMKHANAETAAEPANKVTVKSEKKVGIEPEETVKPEPKKKAAPAKTEAPKIGLTDIRQYAAATPERKALLREILTGYGLEEPKLQFLPEEMYEVCFKALKDGDI